MKATFTLILLITLSSCLVQKQAVERYKAAETEECVIVYDVAGKRAVCTCPTRKDALLISSALNNYGVSPSYDNNTIVIFK